MTYYNEIDKHGLNRLGRLVERGLIEHGKIDPSDIRLVSPDTVAAYRRCHFFAGIGGWPLALELAGWPSDRPVWTGSCPCQPFSTAGKRKGKKDPRHLWPALFGLIRKCRPQCCFGEQVAGTAGLDWLDGVSADLEGEGYAVGSAVLGAHSVGAPHRRQRIYWVAHLDGERQEVAQRCARPTWQGGWRESHAGSFECGRKRRIPESEFRLLVDGISADVGAIKGFGNAIVPEVAAMFVTSFLEIERIAA